MRVSSIRLRIQGSYEDYSDDSEEEYLKRRVNVTAVRASLRAKTRELDSTRETQGVTQVLKPR